jgi:hypothetical protein
MSEVHERPATAAEQYSQAYATHYTKRDFLGALQAYGQVIESHPGVVEAGYARSQIKNIVNLVVPAGELLTSQIAQAVEHLQRAGDDAAAAVLP